MNRIAELKHKINTLETVIDQLKEKLWIEEQNSNNVTRTGKIKILIFGRPYWIVGQRGQVYSVKRTPKNEDQMDYLNSMRRLFLTEEKAIKQRLNDNVQIHNNDAIDLLSSLER